MRPMDKEFCSLHENVPGQCDVTLVACQGVPSEVAISSRVC